MNQFVLEAFAKELFAQGLAGRTKSTYAFAQKRYLTFCATYNITPLPLSEYLLSLLAAYLAQQGLQPQTFNSYLSALKHLQISAVNRAEFPRLQYIIRGISGVQPSSTRICLPITGQIMRALLHAWGSGLEEEFEACLFWAAACTGFFGFLWTGKLPC